MIEINIINSLTNNYIYLLRNTEKNITSVIDPGEAEPEKKILNAFNEKFVRKHGREWFEGTEDDPRFKHLFHTTYLSIPEKDISLKKDNTIYDNSPIFEYLKFRIEQGDLPIKTEKHETFFNNYLSWCESKNFVIPSSINALLHKIRNT